MRQIIAFFFGLIIFVTSCGQVDKKISISQLTGKDTIDKKPNDVYEQVNKENFINSIQKTIIDSSLKQYYLNENCSRFEFDKEDHWFFEKFLDCKTIQELVHKSNKDTLPEKWDCSKILNSKCVNRHFIDSINSWCPFLINNSGKSEQYIPWEQRVVYYFRRPIFSDNGKFAVISGGYSCGGGCGEGWIYLFKMINGEWMKMGKGECYIK